MKQSNARTLAESFDIKPDEPVYVIGVVSQLVRLPLWTLRILDREGVVTPRRRGGRTRLYSLNDLKRLVQVRKLLIEKGVNVKGIKVIMTMTVRTTFVGQADASGEA